MEPDESDEVSQGWCERGQALHERGKTGFTVVPVQSPPQGAFLANRKQFWLINMVHPRQLLAQVLVQAQSELGAGFASGRSAA